MPTYQTADDDVVALVNDVMHEHHPKLLEYGVQIKVLMAWARKDKNGVPKGPALKHHGMPALAIIRITSHEDRVAGLPDAVLKIDADRWEELPADRCRALIDHELTHLVIPEEGEPADDSGRPVLKMREHDYQLAGFWDVVERHKESAVESDQYKTVHKEFTQRCFPWG